MRRMPLYCIALCLAVAVTLVAQQRPRAPKDAEPPLQMEIEIAGATWAAEPGKPLEVEVDGKRLSLRVNVLPHREFRRAGVRFLYPAYYGWEVDRDEPGVTIYTMDGNDCVIMLMKFEAHLTAQAAAESMCSSLTETYGAANVKRAPITLETPGQVLTGTRLQVSLAGERLHQDIFGFRADGSTCVLMLQGGIDAAGSPIQEMKDLRQLLQRTLTIHADAATKPV